jgi:hypothetical protein
MTVNTAYQFIKDRLNKNNSGENQGISKRQFVWAFNMAQLFWFDQRLKADSVDKIRQQELQQFVEQVCLVPSESKTRNFVTIQLPSDYYYYIRSYGEAKDCDNVNIYASLVEEGNVSALLSDEFSRPSLEWEETFSTVASDKLRFYTGGEFNVSQVVLDYYRCPKEIDMEDIVDVVVHSNVDPEISKSSIYEVLNLTALILSGDIGDANSFKAISTYLQQFN